MIKNNINTKIIGNNIIYYDEVDSTNSIAWDIALNNKNCEGTVVIANTQKSGKGRGKNIWFSPPCTGLWMSVLLQPKLNPIHASKFTMLASLAVADALRNVANVTPVLKWPNDVLINSKKISGILTEMKNETDIINFLVIGIGVNVNIVEFPSELRNTATSLMIETNKEISRDELLQHLLIEMDKLYLSFQSDGFLPIRDKWQEYSDIDGKFVKIKNFPGNGNSEIFQGQAIGIDEDGLLIVRTDTGIQKKVQSGEVTIL
ncbi:MAG: biotin--[acetyl-CoA-carboxylase] ligase [Candidatus Firestonebacteria bacterium]